MHRRSVAPIGGNRDPIPWLPQIAPARPQFVPRRFDRDMRASGESHRAAARALDTCERNQDRPAIGISHQRRSERDASRPA